MTDITGRPETKLKTPKQPFDKSHPNHPDYVGETSRGIVDADSNHEQNDRAEQLLKTQQAEQNNRSGFQKGNAQEHQQGNRQK